ncbi:dihydrolipoyl dehydrogenase [Tautonia plasticadhaerens]|uniref:Dihydrolipoyl dehydrogenase n=1 Tax=Tautonia plasticadhaerens TaxID=2527974 RepID=A0A518HCH5_9BACT|nr:dihydrolipoyl dehydrogenase [Tautonia plasticadhaerens]QDV38564.1 Dihydrolipoyl dehydrogenase 3 [Tautonia plasticadhaerens]
MSDRYDLVVIGAGPGGYVAAIRAAQLGMKVACVEKRATLGGTCLNVGCIPSKALLDSSELYELASHRFGRHGIKLEGVGLDLGAMMGRKDQVVKELTQGVGGLFRKNKVEPVFGSATITGPDSVRVSLNDGGERAIEAKAILIATGSVPIELPFLKFDGSTIVDSTGALAFDRVPEHLVVVGGGYIGLELGSVWKRLGAKVTVVEFLPRIVPIVDHELGNQLFKVLQKQGIEFKLETKVTGAEVEGGRVRLSAESKGGETLALDCDKVLVSVGRKGYVEGLGLEAVGVEHDPKAGKVTVDVHFRTTVPSIYALGDVISGPMLAHKAEEEGVAFAELLAGKPGHINYETIPSVIYTWPEVAGVGLTEEQVKERGLDYRVGKAPFIANGRAKAMDEKDGIVKVIADARTDRVLGVHIIGPRASDMIAEAVAVMDFAGSAEDIARICHGHPTLSETLKEAALAVDKRTINC